MVKRQEVFDKFEEDGSPWKDLLDYLAVALFWPVYRILWLWEKLKRL